MAVQQNKKSRSARDMRRSHDALEPNALSVKRAPVKFTCVTTFPRTVSTVVAKVIDKGADE